MARAFIFIIAVDGRIRHHDEDPRMKTIKIYNSDAETLARTASDLGMTPSDLASEIFSEHFARLADDEIPAGAGKQESPPPAPGSSQSATREPLLTPKELAAHFKTTSSTILSWYHDGTIPAEVAVGKVYRFDLDRVCSALARGASLPILKAREQADREGQTRANVAGLLAELDRERKGRRRGSGGSSPGMVPTC
jgi:hypothetical protein